MVSVNSPVAPTAPVTLNPPASFSAKLPPLVKAPRLVMVFVCSRDTVVPALPVRAPVVLMVPPLWLIAWPEVSVTVPELPSALPASVMSLAPVVTSVTPAPATLPVVTARFPPVVVIDAKPPVALTASVTLSPPVASLSVNAPPLVNLPRSAIEFNLSSVTVLPVTPTSVPVEINPVWLTAPLKAFPVSPSTTPPTTPVVTSPSDTKVAFRISTAFASVLVVLSAPARVIAPPPPLTRIFPAPASTVVRARLVTPFPDRLTSPAVVVTFPKSTTPPAVAVISARMRLSPSDRVVAAFKVRALPFKLDTVATLKEAPSDRSA